MLPLNLLPYHIIPHNFHLVMMKPLVQGDDSAQKLSISLSRLFDRRPALLKHRFSHVLDPSSPGDDLATHLIKGCRFLDCKKIDS